MAEETRKIGNTGPDGQSSYSSYLTNFSELVNQLCVSYNRQVGDENPDEQEMLNIFCGLAIDSTKGFEKEMMALYDELDNDSRNLLNRHIDNCGIVKMQSAAISLVANNKQKSKIELIIEIIKKVGTQLIELLQDLFNFPAWLDKIIKIILGLFQIIDNVWPMILELLGIDGLFLKNAEKNLLETYPKWMNLRKAIVSRTS